MRPSAIICLEFCVSVCHQSFIIIMENCTNSEMTDMVPCYGSANGIAFANISGCCRRENGNFRPRSVNRGQERTPRVLDLEPQILETVEENPSTSIHQLVRKFQVSQFVNVAFLKSTPIMFSGYKHCNQTITFAGQSFVGG
jgi:hypothetical protein